VCRWLPLPGVSWLRSYPNAVNRQGRRGSETERDENIGLLVYLIPNPNPNPSTGAPGGLGHLEFFAPRVLSSGGVRCVVPAAGSGPRKRRHRVGPPLRTEGVNPASLGH